MHTDILLATINAKWIHPSLALRLLKANLGPLEENCVIIEFALRQPLREKIEPILSARPRILGLSVSIWNHAATLELLKELRQTWGAECRPAIVLGGPEVSHLPPEADIFRYADYCIHGEGETAFRALCENIINGVAAIPERRFHQVNINAINSGYRLYTDEDLHKKLVYVEASRGCPFRCEFCLSPVQSGMDNRVREFPLEPFLAEMDELIRRGTSAPEGPHSSGPHSSRPLSSGPPSAEPLSSGPLTLKFLDRTFNLNIERARRIMDFFLAKIEERPVVVHFEMIPSRFPPELIQTLARFPPGSLRLEIGIQTLNREVSARIGRPSDPQQELETLRRLREATTAIIHADLIAGLPGEDMDSFGRGFDQLWDALAPTAEPAATKSAAAAEPESTTAGTPRRHATAEIQLGILKLLPGAPIVRHSEPFAMRYSPAPPYEVTQTAALPAADLSRIKNFARFWETIANRGLADIGGAPVFDRFMSLSDALAARFGRNWGIDKHELLSAIHEWW